MTNQQDIFKRLAEYEVEPPAAVWPRILQSFDTGVNADADILCGNLARIQSITVQAPLGSYEFIIDSVLDPIGLSRLQYFETKPPDFILNRIFEDFESKKGNTSTRKVKKLADYKLHAAAVLILLFISGWLIYKSVLNNGQPITPAPVAKDNLPVIPILKDTSAKLVLIDKKGKIKKSLPVSHFSQATIMIGEDKFNINIADNDILTSFASFTYNTVPSFIEKEKKDKSFSIRIDQYAAITVSEPMSEMMRNMNTFRKNGKPTVKAKRERKRLEKWKKTDEKKFDKKIENNPIDPIDLGEFLFN